MGCPGQPPNLAGPLAGGSYFVQPQARMFNYARSILRCVIHALPQALPVQCQPHGGPTWHIPAPRGLILPCPRAAQLIRLLAESEGSCCRLRLRRSILAAEVAAAPAGAAGHNRHGAVHKVTTVEYEHGGLFCWSPLGFFPVKGSLLSIKLVAVSWSCSEWRQ